MRLIRKLKIVYLPPETSAAIKISKRTVRKFFAGILAGIEIYL